MDCINEGDSSRPIEFVFPEQPTRVDFKVSDMQGNKRREVLGAVPAGKTYLFHLTPEDSRVPDAALRPKIYVTAVATYGDGRIATAEHVLEVRPLVGVTWP